MDKARFQIVVVTFYDGGQFRNELENLAGIKILSLGKGGRWDLVGFVKRLINLVKMEKPDIVHGYLDVANLFSLLAGKLNGANVIWGMRASDMDFSRYDWTARFVYKMNVLFSPLPDGIICNSHAGKKFHLGQGFRPKRMEVVVNGINTQEFLPDGQNRAKMRHAWGVSEDTILVGQVGRLDPMKALESFIEAAAKISQKIPDVKFVHVGDGPVDYRNELLSLCQSYGLNDAFIWAGKLDNMPRVYNALDILSLSSAYGEGFPNVVGEAMACAIPCVVTDVGDAASVVGECGRVVPAGDAQALADSLVSLIMMPAGSRLELGRQSRQRVEDLFSVQTLVERSEHIFLEVAGL